MAFTMRFTNGTTTITIRDTCTSTGYRLQGDSYTPQINRRNQTGFGDTFLPVDESFYITVVGSSANDVLEKLEALITLFDSVQLWADSDGAAADALNFVYKPTGSTEVVNYRALVKGNATINYSQYIEKSAGWFKMPNVQISFSRGVWLGAEQTAVSASAVQPSVLQATFSSAADVASPVDVEFSSPSGGASTVGDRHAIISPIDITYLEAESQTLVGVGGVTSVAVAGASGGSVASFDGSTTATKTIYHQFVIPGDEFPYNNFSVWATVRNPSTTTPINWTIETTHEIGSGSVDSRLSKSSIIVESGSVFPRIVQLGSYFIQNTFGGSVSNQIRWNVTNDATDGTGAGDLEIDAFVVHNLDSDTDGFFALNRTPPDGRFGTEGNALTRVSGIVFNEDTAIPENVPASYTGISRQGTVGADIYGMFLDVTDTTAGWITPGSAAARTYTLTATRRLASLTPK